MKRRSEEQSGSSAVIRGDQMIDADWEDLQYYLPRIAFPGRVVSVGGEDSSHRRKGEKENEGGGFHVKMRFNTLSLPCN